MKGRHTRKGFYKPDGASQSYSSIIRGKLLEIAKSELTEEGFEVREKILPGRFTPSLIGQGNGKSLMAFCEPYLNLLPIARDIVRILKESPRPDLAFIYAPSGPIRIDAGYEGLRTHLVVRRVDGVAPIKVARRPFRQGIHLSIFQGEG